MRRSDAVESPRLIGHTSPLSDEYKAYQREDLRQPCQRLDRKDGRMVGVMTVDLSMLH